jgi:hypothetical protein
LSSPSSPSAGGVVVGGVVVGCVVGGVVVGCVVGGVVGGVVVGVGDGLVDLLALGVAEAVAICVAPFGLVCVDLVVAGAWVGNVLSTWLLLSLVAAGSVVVVLSTLSFELPECRKSVIARPPASTIIVITASSSAV